MIKLIIFDMGGVVIDFDERYAYEYLSEKEGISASKIGNALDPLIRDMEYGRIKLTDAMKRVSKKIGKRITEREWVLSFKETAKINKRTLKTVEVLSKRYTVVALTNVTRSRYILFFEHFIDRDTFDRVFGSCYIGMRKPEHKIYRYVLNQMRAKPDEALFIDNLKVNVDGAKEVGINGIVFKNNAQLENDLRRMKVL